MKIKKITVLVTVIFLSAMFFAGCGKSKKQDVDDLNDLDADMIDEDVCEDEELSDDDEVQKDDNITENDIESELVDDDESISPDMDDDDLIESETVDDGEVIFDDDSGLADDDYLDEDTTDSESVDDDMTDDSVPDFDIGDPNILCTGMDECFNNSEEIECPSSGDFYGQDFQYAKLGYCTEQSFNIAGLSPEEIVEDTFTNLFWQRTLPAIYDGCTGGATAGNICQWSEALVYCDNLNYGGFDDWRLPNIEELSTIANYGKHIPAIDSAVFPDTDSNYFWTSSVNADQATHAWPTYFNDGHVVSFFKTKNYYARCVRGGEYRNNGVFEKISFAGQDVILNKTTNLVWADAYSNKETWKSALKYCEDLNYGGVSNWRLPNINELKSLLNYSLKNPVTSFPGMPLQSFWASTSYKGYKEYGWYVNFFSGEVYYHTKSSLYHARCVR